MLGRIRYVVCFGIDLPRRRVKIADVAPIPDGPWMLQVARNQIDGLDGYLLYQRFLLNDPDLLGHEIHYRSMSRAEVC